MTGIEQMIFEMVASKKLEPADAMLLLNESKQDIGSQIEPDVAIIGVSGKFPQAEDLSSFTDNLWNRKSCVGDFPESRLQDYIGSQMSNGIGSENRPSISEMFFKGGYLDRIDEFDPAFFNISPVEAKFMDPLQRLMLESAHHAISDAGYDSAALNGSNTGVYIGTDHTWGQFYRDHSAEQDPLLLSGTWSGILSSRISYCFNFTGPSLVIDTSCSSGLVAVHEACNALRHGVCELAIAGGIHLNYSPRKNPMLDIVESDDSLIRTFDKDANGTVWGEGVGAVILKPLQQALQDRDHIYGVIKGSAVNNDGASDGITAPNARAQEEVICKAWEESGVDPESISYIEVHGTGTQLGDSIEISGLSRAFSRYTAKKQFCAVGTVKTNIGHTVGASGLASLLKVILALQKKELPASINFMAPNPYIDFSGSPVYVNDQLQTWTTPGNLRTAGISSFGFSGTNCHMVVQETPVPSRITPVGEAEQGSMDNPGQQDITYLLPLSAKQGSVLEKLVQHYAAWLSRERDLVLEDLCYTASTGRGHYNHRLAIVFRDLPELQRKLQTVISRGFGQANDPGEGILYHQHERAHRDSPAKVDANTSAGSISRLTDREKDALTRQANEWIRASTGSATYRKHEFYISLAGLYTAGASVKWDMLYSDVACSRVSLPVYPYQRIRCWVESNQHAEYPVNTGQAVQTGQAAGQAVYTSSLSADRDWELNEHRIAGACVLPGTAYIERLADIVLRQGETMVIEDLAFVQPLRLRDSEARDLHIEMDGETGRRFTITSRVSADGARLHHAEGRLRVESQTRKPERVNLAELHASYRSEITDAARQETASSLASASDSSASIITMGTRWDNIEEVSVKGESCLVKLRLPDSCRNDLAWHRCHPALLDNAVNIAIRSLDQDLYLPFYYGEFRLYAPLPHEFYSEVVRRQDEGAGSAQTATFDIRLLSSDGDVLCEICEYTIKKVSGNRLPDEAGLQSAPLRGYLRDWVVSEIPELPIGLPAAMSGETVLVLQGDGVIAGKLSESLRKQDIDVVTVTLDRLRSREDYVELAEEIRAKRIRLIVHALGLTEQAETPDDPAGLDYAQRRGFDSLYHLLNALYPVASQGSASEPGSGEGSIPLPLSGDGSGTELAAVRILIVTDYAHPVSGAQTKLHPHHGCILGLGKVAREEYARASIRCVDLDDETQPEAVLRELALTEAPYQVAYRSGQRYVERLSEQTLAPANPLTPVIRENGVYIITGGTGGLGLEVGQWLSRQTQVNLHLISRSGLENAAMETSRSIQSTGSDESNGSGASSAKRSRQSAALAAMRSHGAQVFSHAVDISDKQTLQAVIDEIHAASGQINGVIHCAGVAGEGFLWDKPASRMQEVLNAKVKGTLVLDQATREDEPDFFLMFSSITSLTGGMGQGDYSAANNYLDAYGSYMQREGRKGMTVNWPLWQGAGMAEDYGLLEEKGLFASILPDQATEMLGAILSTGLPRIITGELNPQAAKDSISTSLLRDYVLSEGLLAQVTHFAASQEHRSAGDVMEHLHLTDTDNYEVNDAEKQIAAIWAEVLGLREISIFANFEDVGGNSLLSVRLHKRLDASYPGLFHISDMFSFPTIQAMAKHLHQKMNRDTVQERTIEQIMNDLENGTITPEQAEAFIAQITF